MSSKGKKEAAVRSLALHPAKEKKSLQSVEVSSHTETKLFAIFVELRNELLKQQQEKETEVSYDEDQLLIDETIPKETDTQENPSIPDISTNLLEEDADIFRNLNIPWMPSDVQDTTTGKPFDSDRENLQRNIKQYRHQMDYMQEVNDGLILENRSKMKNSQEG